MNKILTAMVLVVGLAIPSFAQFDGYSSSFESCSLGLDHRRRPPGPPPTPPPPPPPPPQTVISTEDSPVRLGGRIAIGFGQVDEFTHINAEFGGAVHVRIIPKVFAVGEVDLSLRNYSKTYDSKKSDGYYYEFEDTFTQLSLDVPLIGRYEPLSALFLEGGIKLGFNLSSIYTDSYTCYTSIFGDYVDSGSCDESEWDANTVTVSMLFGIGATLRNTIGRDVDVGVRFLFDLNGSTFDYDFINMDNKLEKHIAGEGHPWSIQFQATYLL